VPATEHKQQTLAQQHHNLMQADHQPSQMAQAPHTPGPDGLAQMIVAITPGRPPLMPTPHREPQNGTQPACRRTQPFLCEIFIDKRPSRPRRMRYPLSEDLIP